VTCNALADLYRKAGRTSEVDRVWKEAVELINRECAVQPSSLEYLEWLAVFQGDLAQEYRNQGKKQLAIGSFKDSAANWKKLVAARNSAAADPVTINYVINTVEAYAKAEDRAQAIALIREHVPIARKQLPARSAELGNLLATLSSDLLDLGAFAEAEPFLRECLEIRAKLAPNAWNTSNAKSMLGAALLGQKKYADAEPLLVAGYEGLKRTEKTMPPGAKTRINEALTRLVHLYEATGKKEEAVKWQKELEARQTADRRSVSSS